MAHLAVLPDTSVAPVIFSVSAPVGRGFVRNLPEDVFLVQTLLAFVGQCSPTPALQPARDLKISGEMDDATHDAILAFQMRLYQTGNAGWPDGRVSPAKTAHYGSKWFTIYALNAQTKRFSAETWPRIDKLGMARRPIADLVQRELTGVSLPQL